jgi:hypothetical protein
MLVWEERNWGEGWGDVPYVSIMVICLLQLLRPVVFGQGRRRLGAALQGWMDGWLAGFENNFQVEHESY